MNNPATEEMSFTETLDGIVKDHAQLQIICMLLLHEGCNKIRGNDPVTGLIMIDAVRKMRARFEEQQKDLIKQVNEKDILESRERIGFYSILFASMSDAVVRDNTIYFKLPPRPAGSAYQCDEIACKAKIFTLMTEYFPSV